MQSNDTTPVEYRPIEGFPGYRVGNDGSVWSCWKHEGIRGRGRGKGSRFVIGEVWKALKFGKQKDGRNGVVLSRNSKRYNRKVHRLVLEAFVGPCPEGMECRHFPDRDPANNRLGNLQWGTKKENAVDRATHGTQRHGTQLHMTKLSEADVMRIIERLDSGEAQASIAKFYRVRQSAIGSINIGLTWGWLTGRKKQIDKLQPEKGV